MFAVCFISGLLLTLAVILPVTIKIIKDEKNIAEFYRNMFIDLLNDEEINTISDILAEEQNEQEWVRNDG